MVGVVAVEGNSPVCIEATVLVAEPGFSIGKADEFIGEFGVVNQRTATVSVVDGVGLVVVEFSKAADSLGGCASAGPFNIPKGNTVSV